MTSLVMKKGFGQTSPVSSKEQSKQWKYTFKNKNSPFFKDDTKSRMEESESHYSVVSNSLQPHGLCGPRNSLGQNTGVDSLSLLQGIFPTQGLNPGLPHCGRILYQLSHGEAQEYWSGWVAWSPLPRIEPEYPALQVDSSPTELIQNGLQQNHTLSYFFFISSGEKEGLYLKVTAENLYGFWNKKIWAIGKYVQAPSDTIFCLKRWVWVQGGVAVFVALSR